MYKDSNLTYLEIEELRQILRIKELNSDILAKLKNKYNIGEYINLNINDTNTVERIVIEKLEEIKLINVDITNLNDKVIKFFDYSSRMYNNNEITEELLDTKYNLYLKYLNQCDDDDTILPFIFFKNFDTTKVFNKDYFDCNKEKYYMLYTKPDVLCMEILSDGTINYQN